MQIVSQIQGLPAEQQKSELQKIASQKGYSNEQLTALMNQVSQSKL